MGRSASLTAVLLVVALVLGTASLAGCGGTVESPGGPAGTGAPAETKAVPDGVRGEVLDRLRAMGITYDEKMVFVSYGASDTHIVVRGPVTGPSGLGTKKVESSPTVLYSEINLDLINGVWKVSETTK